MLLKRKIIHVVGNNYSSRRDILDNYADVICTLEITKLGLTRFVKQGGKQKISGSGRSPPAGVPRNPSILEDFFIKPAPVQYRCNFC